MQNLTPIFQKVWKFLPIGIAICSILYLIWTATTHFSVALSVAEQGTKLWLIACLHVGFYLTLACTFGLALYKPRWGLIIGLCFSIGFVALFWHFEFRPLTFVTINWFWPTLLLLLVFLANNKNKGLAIRHKPAQSNNK